jgi:hypothetical protein
VVETERELISWSVNRLIGLWDVSLRRGKFPTITNPAIKMAEIPMQQMTTCFVILGMWMKLKARVRNRARRTYSGTTRRTATSNAEIRHMHKITRKGCGGLGL